MEFRLTNVDKKHVLEMLKTEQQLRYSDTIQDFYDSGLNKVDDPEFIEKSIQESVLKQYGYTTSETSINHYQSIGSHYKDDDDIKQAIHYLRINIIKDYLLK